MRGRLDEGEVSSVTGGSRLDPWVDAYASRANAMRASEIRALFAVASRPEVVSLAGGMPYVQALPVDMLTDTATRLLTERGATALQYGSGQGDVTLREQILDVIAEVGVSAHPDDIVVTTGSQMALDLVTHDLGGIGFGRPVGQQLVGVLAAVGQAQRDVGQVKH